MDKNRFFFQHYGLTEHDLERYLAAALSAGGEYADLYFEYLSSTSLMVDESMVKSASQGISAGCGVRVVVGERTGYAYTDDLSSERILHAARTAALIASGPAKTPSVGFQEKPARSLYPVTLPSVDAEITAKVELVMRADQSARAYDPAHPGSSCQLCRRVAQHPGGRFRRHLRRRLAAPGAHERFLHRQDRGQFRSRQFRRRRTRGPGLSSSARKLPNILPRKPPARPSCSSTLVKLRPAKWKLCWAQAGPASFCTRPSATDWKRISIARRPRPFAGLIGKRVASEKCTVVDNGTMPWRRGSLNVDDEGQPTQNTVLIENGILKGYLSDKLSSRLMGMADTGNGRRESYEHIPMPRMTNTYMLAGQDDPEDIIRSVKHGVYAVNFGGGQVDITSGKFVFSASEAYLIEDGHVTAPIKGATLIGNGPDVLTRVSMVGNDLKLDEGVGTCGKDGQAVPVGVGIPTLKVDRLTVGGTAKKDPGGFMQ